MLTAHERGLSVGMFESLFSVALLAAFIWAMRALLPKAIRQHDWLALFSALLTAALALLAWLMFGIALRSASAP